MSSNLSNIPFEREVPGVLSGILLSFHLSRGPKWRPKQFWSGVVWICMGALPTNPQPSKLHHTNLSFRRAYSAYDEEQTANIDSLLQAGLVKISLGSKQSEGRGREQDKFTSLEIQAAKAITFDPKTGRNCGGEYSHRPRLNFTLKCST